MLNKKEREAVSLWSRLTRRKIQIDFMKENKQIPATLVLEWIKKFESIFIKKGKV